MCLYGKSQLPFFKLHLSVLFLDVFTAPLLQQIKKTIMKRIITTLIGAFTAIQFAASAQTPATVPSMVIGGIEVRGIQSNDDVLRAIIYKCLVNSKRYVVNDRYDVAEKLGADKVKTCLGKECLMKVGAELNSDFAMSASYDGLGDRILIAMKIVNVKTGEIVQNEIEQFENQPRELNRMTDIMIYRLLKIEVDLSTSRLLIYKDGPSTSTGLGKMNNSGPRIGFAVLSDENLAFFTRSEADGGLGTSTSTPFLFNIGYQLEKQYAGSENFSGLFEFIGNVSGIEHGTPIPSLAILHGVRFGKGAWEIALGPSLSVKKLLTGTKDFDGKFRTYSELSEMGVNNLESYQFSARPDTRGASYFSTNFVVGVGKTLRPGGLNVPINAYASFNKYGTTYGISMGINITRSRSYSTNRL